MRRLACALILFLLAATIYLPTLRNDFVSFDDPVYVTENGYTQMGLTWTGTLWAFRTMHGSNWMPLTRLSHALDVQLFGMNPAGHHATSLLFHAANAAILFLALCAMTGAVGRAFVVAALFAVHPLHVESVAWVAERRDVLSGFFWMLTLWVYSVYVRRPSVYRYLAITLLFAFGLMTKPMVVTLPCVLLLLDFWPLGRLQGQMVGCILEKLPWFGLALASSFVAVLSQGYGGSLVDLAQYSLGIRIENALISYVTYLWKTAWPFHLAAFYPHPGAAISVGAALGCAALLAAVTLVCLWLVSRVPYAGVGWFWYVGTLLPVIGLVQFGAHAMADRYTYFPLIGVFIWAVWGVADVWRKYALPRKALYVLVAVALVALSVRTVDQARTWRNTETLFKHALRFTHESLLAHTSLGAFYLTEQRYDEAEQEFRAALRIAPRDADSMANLGIVLLMTKRNAEADTLFQHALEIEPHHTAALMNHGYFLAGKGKPQEALACFEQALATSPEDVNVRYGLGLLLIQLERIEEAAPHVRFFLRVHPDRIDVRRVFASACMRANRFQDGVEQCEAIARMQPDSAEAFANLGIALDACSRNQEALDALRRACALRPDNLDVRMSLANALSRAQRWEELKQALGDILQQRPNDAEAHYLMGVALAESGQRDEASTQFLETLRIQPQHSGALEYRKKLGDSAQ